MDISNLNIKELKALAFDFANERDIAAGNLNTVLQQLERVKNMPAEVPEKPEKPKAKESK